MGRVAGDTGLEPVITESKSVALTDLANPQYVARPQGLEPRTLGLEGRCSIQLSYGRLQWSG